MRDEHLDNEAIAQQRGITIEAVEPLFRVAAAKLDRIREVAEPMVQRTGLAATGN